MQTPLAALILVALAACITEPDGSLLSGQFGGRRAGLLATDTAAYFEFTCAGGTTGPLRVDRTGLAHASGVVFDSWPPDQPWSLHVTVRLSGEVIDLATVRTTRQGGSSGSYQLRRGVAADFSGVACLASRHLHEALP